MTTMAGPVPISMWRNDLDQSSSPPRIAYLTNAYPKVSHSFIRREILALETQGFEVLRVSIRNGGEDFPDAADRTEAALTSVLFDGGIGGLVIGLLVAFLKHPARFVLAMAMAIATGLRGSAGLARSLAYLAEACRLVRLLEAARIRHLHVHFGTNPAAVARLARKLSGITYSMTLHGPDEFDAPAALLLAEKIHDATFVIVVSDFSRGQAMRWSSPSDWHKIRVIRCGLDRTLLDLHPGYVANDREPDAPSSFLCIARLSAQKGLNLLLDAMAAMDSGETFCLRIVGDGELRVNLEEQIKRLGLESRVTLLGWCDGAAIRREILNARALVLPSLAEGLPVVLMEALALGCPVVATCIAGIPELVDEQCGYLIPSGSELALAHALQEVLESAPARLASMGAIGRRRVLQYHDVDRNVRGLAKLLRPFA